VRYRPSFTFLAALALALAVAGASAVVLGQNSTRPRAKARESLARVTLPLREACRAAGAHFPPPAPRLIVHKAERRLGLYSGGTLIKEYTVGLGPVPIGHKEQQGDGRTPEGDYYVCTRLERSRFHRFLGLSYPGIADARRGLRSGLTSRADHDRILAAHRKRRQPPWGTRLGGAVGIHGSGGSSDWTAGCVAVEDREVEELFTALPLGTPVKIEP